MCSTLYSNSLLDVFIRMLVLQWFEGGISRLRHCGQLGSINFHLDAFFYVFIPKSELTPLCQQEFVNGYMRINSLPRSLQKFSGKLLKCRIHFPVVKGQPDIGNYLGQSFRTDFSLDFQVSLYINSFLLPLTRSSLLTW